MIAENTELLDRLDDLVAAIQALSLNKPPAITVQPAVPASVPVTVTPCIELTPKIDVHIDRAESLLVHDIERDADGQICSFLITVQK